MTPMGTPGIELTYPGAILPSAGAGKSLAVQWFSLAGETIEALTSTFELSISAQSSSSVLLTPSSISSHLLVV